MPAAPQRPPACGPAIQSPSSLLASSPRGALTTTSTSSFFKLHKLRALRRKVKVKGGLIRPDEAASMASAHVPLSPTSSKRSRSRDSTRSATNSSALNTPWVTPSVSTNSLIIPSSSSGPGTPSNADHYVPDGTPYPAFLRLSRGGR
jgi:hypothetical protein